MIIIMIIIIIIIITIIIIIIKNIHAWIHDLFAVFFLTDV